MPREYEHRQKPNEAKISNDYWECWLTDCETAAVIATDTCESSDEPRADLQGARSGWRGNSEKHCRWKKSVLVTELKANRQRTRRVHAKVNREKVETNERVMQRPPLPGERNATRSDRVTRSSERHGGRKGVQSGRGWGEGKERRMTAKRERRVSYSWHCARPSGKVARIQRGCRLAGCRLLEQLSSFSHCRASRVRATDASVNLHPCRVKLSFLPRSLLLLSLCRCRSHESLGNRCALIENPSSRRWAR